MAWKSLISLCLLCVIAATCDAQATRQDTERLIRDLITNAGLPGLQTIVVKSGSIIWDRAYGSAVLERPGPQRAMRNDTIVNIGSISKVLVAIAVLQQVEQGRLGLDDDVNSSLPFKVRNPRWPDTPITWRMLLTHTSSLQYEDDEVLSPLNSYGQPSSVTLESYIEGVFVQGGRYSRPNRFSPGKPGTERIYSNDAVDLAAYALQRIVHESFDHFVQQAILDPLRMRDSGYSFTQVKTQRLAVRYASVRGSHREFSFPPAKTFWAQLDTGGSVMDHQVAFPDYPSGGLYSTARDWSHVLTMLANGGSLDGAVILKKSSVDLMQTPTGFYTVDGWAQGMGIAGPKDIRGSQVWGHVGEDRGVATAFYFNPKTGVGVIAFANAMDPDWTMAYRVVDIALHLMAAFD